jgi:two-component system chemotaxis response regulator CheB
MSAAARPRPLHVLVVDDSAVVRQVMSALLAGEAGITVSAAADPLIAVEKMRRTRPDVILLDLEMPRMNGLTFLRKLMAEDPIPVVVCAGLAGPDDGAALRALEEGAVEIVVKPRLEVGHFLRESRAQLLESLRAAAQARPERRARRGVTPLPAPRAKATAALRGRGAPSVAAIGASTGGTEALRAILDALPADAPGLVMVQHMPAVYTRAFAQRLDATSRLAVKEAEPGDRVLPGRALLAPGNRHLRVVRAGLHYEVSLDDGPPVNRHRPSVDVLFHSVAASVGEDALAVLLTGMGDDGAAGLLALRRRGAATVAQDEATSVVFGMPKEAIALGAAERVLPLDAIAEVIAASVPGRRAR